MHEIVTFAIFCTCDVMCPFFSHASVFIKYLYEKDTLKMYTYVISLYIVTCKIHGVLDLSVIFSLDLLAYLVVFLARNRISNLLLDIHISLTKNIKLLLVSKF